MITYLQVLSHEMNSMLLPDAQLVSPQSCFARSIHAASSSTPAPRIAAALDRRVIVDCLTFSSASLVSINSLSDLDSNINATIILKQLREPSLLNVETLLLGGFPLAPQTNHHTQPLYKHPDPTID